MKKLLIVLGVVALLFSASLFFWPRLDIPEGAAVTLFSSGTDLERVHRAVDPEDCNVLRRILDGRLLLPDWTDTFTGQQFYLSAEIEHGLFIEWYGGSAVLYLPKLGTRQLLQLAGNDALIWLDSASLDALKGIFEAQGVFYPPVLEK